MPKAHNGSETLMDRASSAHNLFRFMPVHESVIIGQGWNSGIPAYLLTSSALSLPLFSLSVLCSSRSNGEQFNIPNLHVGTLDSAMITPLSLT
ncbi:hypothetical protein SAY87_002893 [Trapa incisa]|uniref:Uncharacterized protein n=1 Tax=Trapa incisa TaxID=236973 RepID=A0AAN7KRK1_9MYRT|nr:hypothetical protein SAY87_002893 [Trapa incisa]